MIELFSRDPACASCPLSASGVRTVCVPTVLDRRGGQDAMVWIGQNPGYNEDRSGRPFVGRSGSLLNDLYIHPFLAAGLEPTMYKTNAVRCYADKVPGSAQKACPSLFLIPDLERIMESHHRVALICLGAFACRAVSGWQLESPANTLTAFVNRQPIRLFPQREHEVMAFATYHPAAVMRKSTLGRVVIDHLNLVRRWLTGALPSRSKPKRVPPRLPWTSSPTGS